MTEVGDRGLPKPEKPKKRRGVSITSRGMTMGNTRRGGLKPDHIIEVLKEAERSGLTLAEFLKRKSGESGSEEKQDTG